MRIEATTKRRRVAEVGATRIEKNLTMTPEASRLLAGLASRSGLSEGDVILVALSMFRTALDAKEKGAHFGIAASPEALDVELVGF